MPRPKGSKNRVTRDAKESIRDFVNGHFTEFEKRMSSLDDRRFCDLYVKLAQLIVPRAQPEPADYYAPETPITVISWDNPDIIELV